VNKPAPKRGLGRGLGSLIPTAAPAPSPESDGEGQRNPGVRDADFAAGATNGVSPDLGSTGATRGAQIEDSGLKPVEGAYFAELPLTSIRPNHVQPRSVFDEEAMDELVHSIREIGVLQPVVVRQVGDEFELVMGERRYRASQRAGLSTIPAIVRETEDTDMLRDALLENLHRSQLNPLEEASAYQQLLEDFGCTHDELASRIGRSRPQISNTLRLLKLSPAVQRRVAAGVLSAGHARSLLGVGDAATQDQLAQRVVAEGISVRGLEEIVALREIDGAQQPQRRSARLKGPAPELNVFADRLADRFETSVKVDMGRTKGKITVEFATLEDLQRIVEIMDPRNRTDKLL
jgi:ParB family chromosome partitioning protein